jgi:hypothetical protein
MRFFVPSSLAAALLLTSFLARAQAEPVWFDVGGPGPSADVVELDVSDIKPGQAIKSLSLRVSLAAERILPSGERYSSYTSEIEIDCAERAVIHRKQTRYAGPRWTGAATTQEFPGARPMAFRGLQPDPKPRVLRAACPAG